MNANHKLETEMERQTIAQAAGESIDPHELRGVLLGVRELMNQVRNRTLLRELRSVHDRIADMKIVDRSSGPISRSKTQVL